MHCVLMIVVTLFLVPILGFSQQDFSKLTPKQKIKLAKREQKEAQKDQDYIQLMAEGKVLFQQKEYEKALAKYNEAHNRRPNNVYPMVMLEDIKVAQYQLKVESEPTDILELATQTIEQEPTPQIPKETESFVLSDPIDPIDNEEIPLEVEENEEAEIVINTPETIEKTIVSENVERNEPTSIVYESDGIYLDTLTSGSAKIFQVTIVDKGANTVYRKVIHTWGGIFYFMDDKDLTEREYRNRMKGLGIEH